MNNPRVVLAEYGLNDKEIGLYLAALKLGECNISNLAKEAGVKRSTAYTIFRSLAQKGLVGSYSMRDGLRVVPSSPATLLSLSKKRVAEIESILPLLTAQTSDKNQKPKITYYEGREGFINALEDSLKKPNVTLRHIGSLAGIHKTIPEDYDLKHYLPMRIKNNIRFHCLYFSDLAKKIKSRNHEKELREVRFLPDKYKHNSSMVIYENKVILTSSINDLSVVVIESEDIAQGERAKFDLMWDLVGPAK